MFSIIRKIRARFGRDKFSAETFDRLIQSMHVEDLRWVARVTMVFALSAICVIAIIAYGCNKNFLDSKLYAALVPFQISAVLAAVGGIFSWCYQTGSGRLGIVDIFACEMTTLCRICTISGLSDTCIEIEALVLDADDAAVADHDMIIKRREQFSHFDSAETYTPVFDANAKELQSLSVKVVINITAFYAYWKATRDAFRKLANTQAAPLVGPVGGTGDSWHQAMCNVIYMQFLALESARKAVHDLIEFEPNKAENTILILLSELPAYRFLSKYFSEDDVRHARLEKRRSRYQRIVPQLYYYIEGEHAKCNNLDPLGNQLRYLARGDLEELSRDWDKAYCMLKDLKIRYEAAIGEFPRREAIVLLGEKQESELGCRANLSAAVS